MGWSARAKVITVLALILAACSGSDTDAPTTNPPPSTTVASTSPTTTSVTSTSTTVASGGPVVDLLDEGIGSDVFVLLESGDRRKAAGWNRPLVELTPLPDDAEAAAPDGRGGIVFTTNDQVWWIDEPGAEPTVLEYPGVPVRLVGLRYVDGDPEVLVLIGDKLIGYDQDRNQLRFLFDQIDGDVIDIDVDGDRFALIVETTRGLEVQLVSITSGEVVVIAEAIEADRPEAPRRVAISGDRIVVLNGRASGAVLTVDGTQVGFVGLGIEDIPLHTLDLAGTQLLAAFDEAATVTDIETEERYAVRGIEGRVLGAVWGEAPESEPPDASAATRFRVNTDMVEADTADPYLNVRWGPDVANELLAKLPPTYTGIRRTGEEETSDDGAVWYQVELLDPIHATPGEPLEGRNPVGWVNSAFLEPLPEGLPVTLDEIPGCVDEYNEVSATSGSRPPEFVYALESAYLSDHCLRVVVTFGSGETPAYWGDSGGRDVGPANAVPGVRDSHEYVDLGDVEIAWWNATETTDGVYLVDTADGPILQAILRIDRTTIRAVPERGILVVDLSLQDHQLEVPSSANVALTRPIVDGSDTVVVTGVARPFEGQLGVRILDSSGQPTTAVYSGSLEIGTIETAEYVVQISDWFPAWRPFAVMAEGLEPGEYELALDPNGVGGVPGTLRVSFTADKPDYTGSPGWVAEFAGPPSLATAEEQDAIRALVAFANGEVPRTSVPFAEEVTLGLNTVDFRVRSRTELTNRESWNSSMAEFDGLVGGFNALDHLTHSRFVRITAGPAPHCAGPPLEWPDGFDGWRQVNIEPIGIDSCLQWHGVNIFFNEESEIAAVVLDLWGP